MNFKQFRHVWVAVAIAVLALTVVGNVGAQVNSNAVPIQLTAQVNESVTLSCSTGQLTLTANPTPFTCSVTWNLASGHTKLQGDLYFPSTTALTGTAGSITSTQVIEAVTGQGSGTCNANMGQIGQANACTPDFFDIPLTSGNPLAGQNTAQISLSIPAMSGTSIPPGTYAGTISAQVFTL